MKSGFFHLVNPSHRFENNVRHYFYQNASLHHHWVKRDIHPTHFETLLEWAYHEGYRHFAIWGGDGSLSRAIQFLFERQWISECRLALVPVGTCNDFARHLKLTSWQLAAQNCLRKKEFTGVDVGLIQCGSQKRVFINNAGFGRESERISTQKPQPIKDIFTLRSKSISVEWDSKIQHEFQSLPGLMMIVFNAPFFSKGLHFYRSLPSDDGALNGVIVPDMSRWKLFLKLLLGRLGVSLMDSSMVLCDAKLIHVKLKSAYFIQADGEIAFDQPQTDITFSVLPKALQLLSSI